MLLRNLQILMSAHSRTNTFAMASVGIALEGFPALTVHMELSSTPLQEGAYFRYAILSYLVAGCCY
jgi:hypothetical protein